MKKRTVSWLLIVVLLISISGLPAALAEGEENYDVTVEGDVKTVVVYSSTYDATTDSSVYIDGTEASNAAQTEGSSVSVESGAPGSPVVEATVEGSVTSVEESGWNNTAAEANAIGEGSAATITTTGNVEAASSDGGATGVEAKSSVSVESSFTSSSGGDTYSSESTETPVGTGGETTVNVGGIVKAEGGGYGTSGVEATAYGEGSTTTVTTAGSVEVEATSSDGGATGVSARSDVAIEYSFTSSSGEDTYSSESTQTPVGTGGETTAEIGGEVKVEGSGYGTSGVEADAAGEGSTTTVTTTGNVEVTSSDGSATGVDASSYVISEYSRTSTSEGGTESSAPVGKGGETTVEIGGNVKAEGANYSSGIQADATGEGSTTTVTTTGNVEVTSSDGSATGVDASSYVTSESSRTYTSERDTGSSAPVGKGGETTVEIGGNVKAKGANYSSGIHADAAGEGSTTTVTTTENVEVTSSDGSATGVDASSAVATENSHTYSYAEESYSQERTDTPVGTGGETTVEVGGGVKVEGANYSTGILATANGEGSTTTVTTTDSVEVKSSDDSATGVSARSNVAFARVNSFGEGSYESSQTPSGSGGTTTVEIGGDVKAEGTDSTSGIWATANGEGSTTTVAVDGAVDVKATANYSNNISGVFAQANPAFGYGGSDGTIERLDGGTVSVTTGNVIVTVEKIEAASSGESATPPPVNPEEEIPDERYENPYGTNFGYGSGFYYYNGVAGVNASTVDYGAIEDDSSKRSVIVTTGDVTVNAADLEARGVNADGEGTTVDTGAIAVEANAESDGIHASLGATVTADGNVTSSGDGVDVADGANVKVKGDVKAESNAIAITLRNADDAKSRVTIEGTADSENQLISLDLRNLAQNDEARKEASENAAKASEAAYNAAKESGKTNEEAYNASRDAYNASMNESWKAIKDWVNSEEGVNAIVNALPQIIVETVPQKENVDLVLVTGVSDQNKATISEKVLSQINYIINQESLDLANIAVYGYDNLDGYLVAKENYTLTVKSIGNGSIAAVTAGQYANVVNNGDGSYTITVNRGGDLRLMANFIAGVVAEGGAGGASGKIYRDDSSYGGKVFLYVEENKLIADMTVLSDATILTSTLMRFVQRYGVDTFVALTANGSFTVAIDELVELLNGASCFTLVVKGDTMDLYGDWKPITTLSMMSST